MRTSRTVGLLGLLAAAGSMIGQASAASPATTYVRCSLHAHVASGQLNNHGAQRGSVRCGRPLGKGSYHGQYRDFITPSPFTGGETGSSRLSFESGTLRGTYAVDRTLIASNTPFRGTLHITGGTGRFTHASGTLKMTCLHRIPPLTSCIVSGPVSGL